MPKLVLEPLQPEEERKKKKKKKPKKPVEAPEDNYFTGRQARIDEVNRIAQLSAEEEAQMKKEMREKEIEQIVEREQQEKRDKNFAKANAAPKQKLHRPTFVRTLDMKHYAEVK